MKSFVIDASAVVALIADAGPTGDWVAEAVSESTLHAPDLVMYEAANTLRRQRSAGRLDDTSATLAHQDLLDLAIHLDPYCGVAERVWQLRDNVTSYEAAYVAVAEVRNIPLITLDAKLANATGPRCRVLTP